MKVVTHKCPNCNANLKLKDGNRDGVCEYCGSHFTIDDGIKRVEHSGTVEITDDTSLKVAYTTLHKFKDYDTAYELYLELLDKYAHKPEVYIGLILSITNEFKKEITRVKEMEEINDYWEKYTSIASDHDCKKYLSNITSLNKEFWLKILNDSTNNFKDLDCKVSSRELNIYWNNYILYCDKNEKAKLEDKVNKFITSKYNKEEKKKKTIKIVLITILVIILVAIISICLYFLNEKVVVKNKEVKVSELSMECHIDGTCSSYNFLEKNLDKTYSDIVISNVVIDKENLKITFTTYLKNIFKTEEKDIEFKLIDDMGPVIEEVNCSYTDTDNIDLNTCFKLYDYSDGEIDNSKAIINTDEIDFKEAGNKIIEIKVSDKDGNESKKDINVNITKSDLVVNASFGNTYVEVNKTIKFSYSISPDVKNKNVSLEYDKNIVSIDENNNIKGLKYGTTTICIVPEYDVNKKHCFDLRVINECKNSYTFNFDGGTEKDIIAGLDFCPGTYKVYVGLLNKNNPKSIYFYEKEGEFMHKGSLLVWKGTSHNEEGDKHTFLLDNTVRVTDGITSVTLKK